MELVIPKPMIWLPRYARPGRPGGLIPPSPPAEQRARREKAILRAVRSFTGRLPDGWQAMARIGTPGAMTGGMQSLSGVEQQLFGPNVPPITGPTAFWRMEEASGNRVDSVGGSPSCDFAPSGAGGLPGNVAGKIGNALILDATKSQFLSQASNTRLVCASTASMTIAGWFYVTAFDGNFPDILSKGTAGFYEYRLSTGFFSGNVVFFSVNNTSSANAQWGSALSTGTWYFVAAYYDSGVGTAISVNDSNLVTKAYATAFSSGTRLVSCGETYDGAAFLAGRIDALGFWQSKISATDITNIYNAGTGREYYSGAWH